MHCNRRRQVKFELLEDRRLMSAGLTTIESPPFVSPIFEPIGNPIVFINPMPPPIVTTIDVTSHKPAVFTDAAGTTVSVRLTGPGTAALGFSANGNADIDDLTLTGTTLASSFTITPLNHARTSITGDINITGPLGKFIAPRVDLATNPLTLQANLFNANAAIWKISIGNVTGLGTEDVTIAGSFAIPLHFRAGTVADTNFSSYNPIASIHVASWTAPSGLGASLFAPSLGDLNCRGDFIVGVDLYGHGLAKDITIGGSLGTRPTPWVIGGNVDSLRIGEIPTGFSGTIGGRLDSLVVKGDDAGTLAAGHFGDVAIGGNLTGARILAGVYLGPSGNVGGSGNDEAAYASGSINSLQVSGTATNSLITAGFEPTDQLFDNSDGILIGGRASFIHDIDLRKGIDGGTQFVAGAFGTAQIPNAVNPAKDGHFIVP